MMTLRTPILTLCAAAAALALSACDGAPVPTNAQVRAALEAGEFADARALMGQIFTADAADAETQRIKLDLMLELEDGHAAMAAIDALPQSALGADERRIATAHALILQGKPEAAGALYADIAPAAFAEQDYRMVLWALDEMGEDEQFEAGMDAGLQAFPQSADLNAMAAQALLDRDQPDEAPRFADTALASDPDHYAALLVKGELAILAGDLEAALDHYTQASQRYPGRAIPVANIAGLQMDLGRIEAAGETLARALAGHPDEPFLQWQLVRHALATDDLDTARRALEAARRTYRGNDEFTLLSAQAEERFGNRELALAEYRRYLRAVEDDPAIEARIAALEAGV